MIAMWVFFIIGHWLGMTVETYGGLWWATPFVVTGACAAFVEFVMEVYYIMDRFG
jgi:hypothetical protein